MLTVGALFAGIGGIEFGLERTGYFETRWFVENDGFCQKILRKHWPRIPVYGDITTLDLATLPKVDILTGGFPCQDISVAGTGKGIKEGTRSGLWFYFAKAIGILRPKYALIENVPMLAKRGLDIVLANLAEAGYDAEWFDLRASDFGAPHRRERIFIVAGQPDLERRVIADDWGERIQRFVQEKVSQKRGFSWCKDVRRVEDFMGRPNVPQPLFRGTRDGIPDWVDRIRALGNAVVPDCAEFVGEMILEFDEGRK